MIREYTILLVCIIQSLFLNEAFGQELIVRDLIQDPSDISASTNRRIDSHNEPCALLKVQVIDQIVAVEGAEMIGDLQCFGATTWVYVPHGTKQLTLLFEEHNPVGIQMQNYDIDQLNRLSTYVLTLIDKSGVQDPDNPTDAIAQFELGKDYQLGRRGKTMDYEKAYQWFLKSAEQGYEKAQTMLGSLHMETYENFTKNPSDFEKGILWLEKAAEQGDVNASYKLALAYFQNSPDDNCEEYNSKGLLWALKAAEQGRTEAMEMVGDLLTGIDYLDYPGIDKNTEKGVKWYEKASNLGSSYASFQLGLLYQKGIGIKKDKKMARKWYEKSYNQGEDKARARLKDPDLN